MDFLWNDDVQTVDLCCLLPYGITITLENYDTTNSLSDVKKNLWGIFKSYPFYSGCDDLDNYVFIIINFKNYEKPHCNESDKISEIKPLFNILKIVEKKDTCEDFNVNQRINSLIGKNVSEFMEHGSQEVVDFKRRIDDLHLQIENDRIAYTEEEKLNYFYPLRLNNNSTMINLIKKQLKADNFIVVVKYENHSQHSQFTICVPYNILPENLLSVALNKMNRAMIKRISNINDYILKVWDREEFIFGNHSLINFVYIQETLSRNGVPTISTVLKKSIEFYDAKLTSVSSNENSQKSIENKIEEPLKEKYISSWSINAEFKLTLHSIYDLNCDLSKYTDICVYLGLFHADKLLCSQKESSEKPIKNRESVKYEENIIFPIKLGDLPRMTKLCIVISERNKSIKLSKSKKINNKITGRPLAWTNATIFDYKGFLKSKELTLTTWTFADDNQYDDIFNPLGTVEANPRSDECATIKLTLDQYGFENNIKYPSEAEILKYSATVAKENLCKDRDEGSAQDTRSINVVLTPYSKSEKIEEMVDQDRNVIWSKRLDVLNGAHEELPILLRCVNWNKKEEVAEMISLLKNWKLVSTERALELLDYSYPDPSIRKFAISSLKQLEDEELLLYLLQLAQSIKHEAYLNCDLVIFLIERALKNQRIGHFFFWHLRSEMHVPCIQNKFGLILEAFLKGTHISQINAIQKQLEGFEKLKEGSELAKKGNKEKVKAVLQEFLGRRKFNDIFNKFQNPLNPSYSCKGIKVDCCKVMDSKMKPLWIVFENLISSNDDISIIFKNGDDLRQDMLTLQMLKVMDKIWKNEGYDFRMNIYDCISMEKKMGMIEVVLNAETIANIQKKSRIFSATSPFKKGSIFAWIKEHNQTEDQLKKAIEEFTYSCAGYCVATYVLGVADRHSDNIMIKKNGQLFHIDFGHILGHFKEKFGFCRERVPFVLTHDFVYVINKGATGRDATEFSTFQKLCEDAFLILRKHGYLILSLFSMMISTGLPELSSEKDLNYLKETLVLKLSEVEALEHFRSKFSDALENSWTTSLNWATHNFSKNNK